MFLTLAAPTARAATAPSWDAIYGSEWGRFKLPGWKKPRLFKRFRYLTPVKTLSRWWCPATGENFRLSQPSTDITITISSDTADHGSCLEIRYDKTYQFFPDHGTQESESQHRFQSSRGVWRDQTDAEVELTLTDLTVNEPMTAPSWDEIYDAEWVEFTLPEDASPRLFKRFDHRHVKTSSHWRAPNYQGSTRVDDITITISSDTGDHGSLKIRYDNPSFHDKTYKFFPVIPETPASRHHLPQPSRGVWKGLDSGADESDPEAWVEVILKLTAEISSVNEPKPPSDSESECDDPDPPTASSDDQCSMTCFASRTGERRRRLANLVRRMTEHDSLSTEK